ncbi:unnamed protein product [Rhodiola kirilowii]
MKDNIDQMMQMQAAMMRMLTTPGYQPPSSQSPNGNNRCPSNQGSHEDNRRE